MVVSSTGKNNHFLLIFQMTVQSIVLQDHLFKPWSTDEKSEENTWGI